MVFKLYTIIVGTSGRIKVVELGRATHKNGMIEKADQKS